MATYNKRGYKETKEKVEPATAIEGVEEIKVDERDSTTAGVFNSLDEGANKVENWVAKNQNYIFGIVGGIALLWIGYLLYGKYVSEPNENNAANDMFMAQENFNLALNDETKKDSLLNLSLNGSEGKQGFIKLSQNYSGTDAGNLANYYAGITYLNLGKNKEAIKYLEDFSSKDMILSVLATGAIGDAFSQQNQPKDALEYYEKALSMNENDLTTPRFLLKAAQTALLLGKKEDAKSYFTTLKEKYENSSEARNIDALLGLAE
jgi:tetratricopeptide (TPR) repeat protein